MTGFSIRTIEKTDIILLFVAVGCLIATAIQYPLSTTFPIGGDAAAHIKTVQHIATRPIATLQLIGHSWYPAIYLLFSTLAFIPNISWVDAYPWWMAAGQILTGCALGLLAYRLAGIKASAIAIGIWALTPITMTSFFEDGTMGQLWSLPWITLFFERLTAKSLRGMALFAILATLSHPITSLILLATLMFTTLHLWIERGVIPERDKKIRKIFTWITATIMVAILYIATRTKDVLLLESRESSLYIPELFHGFFLPWLMASILGWAIYVTKRSKHTLVTSLGFGCFFFISFLLAANNYLDIGFWTNRLNVYVLLCITAGAAIGITSILKGLRAPIIATLMMGSMLIGLTISVWNDNANIYKRNESTNTYIRIHPEELEAISWIRDNTPLHAIVFTSNATRHYEWIPVLSSREWVPITIDTIQSPKYAELENEKYIVFFTRKEEAPEHIRTNTAEYSLVYNESAVEIFRVIPKL